MLVDGSTGARARRVAPPTSTRCAAGGSRCGGPDRGGPMVAGRPGVDARHVEPGCRPPARPDTAPRRAVARDGHHDPVPGRPSRWPLPDHHLPATGDTARLVDWSGDGSHALFSAGHPTLGTRPSRSTCTPASRPRSPSSRGGTPSHAPRREGHPVAMANAIAARRR